MFLKYRTVRLQDLPECLSCVRDSFVYSDEAKGELLALWKELLSSGMANAAVMEDQFAPEGQKIVWFCGKVFISDEYAHFLKVEAAPFVGTQVLGAWRKGRLPLLTQAEIRRANSGDGVNILVLNSGAPARMLEGDNLTVLADRVVDFSWYFSSGYKCKEMLEEFYDDFTWRWAENSGFRLRTDYGRYYETHQDERPAVDQTPRLYGVNARESQAMPGSLASLIFRYNTPKFRFRAGEQELLNEALLGETDDDLARSLGVASVTVRKRWDSIYARVSEVAPQLLPDSSQAGVEHGRSTEKKRRLLSYLRQHLEELRPHE